MWLLTRLAEGGSFHFNLLCQSALRNKRNVLNVRCLYTGDAAAEPEHRAHSNHPFCKWGRLLSADSSPRGDEQATRVLKEQKDISDCQRTLRRNAAFQSTL